MTEGVPTPQSKRRECPSQPVVRSQSLLQSSSPSPSPSRPQPQPQSRPQSQSSHSLSDSQTLQSSSSTISPRQSTFRRLPRRPPVTNTPTTPPPPKPVPPPAPTSASSTRPPSANSSATSQPVNPSPSKPQSSSASPTPRVQAPYRPGFQPKGLYRPLTDEFLALRRLKRDGDGADGRSPGMKRVERTKMLRRLEKLIDLHFPSASQQASRRPQAHRRASSLFDFDIRKISISDAGDLLRGVVGGGDVQDLRAAEQRITPWQDDAHVTKCPLCSTSFHPLTNRKHHCRLCGQIICSLPVKHPHRLVTCSLLFVVDPETRRLEEVREGVDYGVRRKPLDNGNGASHKGGPAIEDKFLKGVRICRSCRPILLRQQYQFEFTHVPLFSKLYQAFIALEQEIEESIPQFQELVISLSLNDQPSKEASISRKRLLEAFAQYDALAKRIRKLPCPVGSSADQVQSSIMNRANLFLQKNMFPLQSLPQPKKLTEKTASQDGHKVDPDSEMAMALQPLLEQEALLESFVEEAKAHRKFEDVKALKTNLQEIRAEIDRIVVNADAGLQ